MAKRFQPLNEFSKFKKPKLDIAVSREKPPSNEVCDPITNHFWDDDDDDVILLATQVAEGQAAANTGVEDTFSEFAPNIYGTTSTQAQKPNTGQNHDVVASMFEDDDEFEFLAIAATEETTINKPALETAASTSKSVEKEPSKTNFAQTQSDARKRLASERQIQFLVERISLLKKESTQLNFDLIDAKYRLENKDGECSLLRDEVRHLKQKIQTLKMENVVVTEEAKMKCKTHVNEIHKVVSAKESELKLKDQEYEALKIRTKVALSKAHESTGEKSRNNENQLKGRNRFRIDKLFLDKNTRKTFENNANTACEDMNHENREKNRRTIFDLELEKLYKINVQLSLKYLKPAQVKTVANNAILSISKVFSEFWSYVHSLDYLKSGTQNNFSEQYKLHRKDLFQQMTENENEIIICIKRYLFLVAAICRRNSLISSHLLSHKQGDYLLLQIAIDAITKLGYSTQVCEHFGILESFATILLSLLQQQELHSIETHYKLLFEFLKQLVLIRPNMWVFYKITTCVLASTNHSKMLSLFCINTKSSLITQRIGSAKSFTTDTCLMEVYASLLEISLTTDVQLQPQHFKLLLKIGLNHIRFVYHCFISPPNFVINMLALDDDNQEFESVNQISTSSDLATTNFSNDTENCTRKSSLSNLSNATNINPEKPNCKCYIKMCSSVVALVFQLLRQWVLTDRKYDTDSVAQISQSAVHLLNIIYREYYTTSLFRDAEETTKHYFALICRWWMENSVILKFTNVHLNFLKHLQDSHFMLKPFHEDGNLETPSKDLTEWQRYNNETTSELNDELKKCQFFDVQKFNPLNAEILQSFFDGIDGYAYNFQ